MSIQVEIRDCLSGYVLYTATVGVNVPQRHQVREAVEAAVRDGANIYGADLNGADLNGVNFRSARLRSASLVRTDLTNTDFTAANLSWSNFDIANAQYAYFDRANLYNARFIGARLMGASFVGATITNIDFSRADLRNANFTGAHMGLHNIQSLIARATHSDGYEAFAWRTMSGSVLITAGCRCIERTNTYHEHIKTYYKCQNGEALATETMTIDTRVAQKE